MHIHWCNCPVQILSLVPTVCGFLFAFSIFHFGVAFVAYWYAIERVLFRCYLFVLFQSLVYCLKQYASLDLHLLLLFSWFLSKLSAMITWRYFPQLVYLWLARSFWYAIYMRSILCHCIQQRRICMPDSTHWSYFYSWKGSNGCALLEYTGADAHGMHVFL